ncbi:MAG: flagellar motor switch protein FliG, partial [Alphaproteobacteria bacterium]|nr:flagellar motor switch protein FliG [Alphaproteobacteria bacterium]
MTDDVRSLTGRQKAAIVIMAIGEERATRLFSLMDEEEIKELSQSMASLGSINAKVVEALFIEFASQLSSTGSLVGSFDSTERLLRNTLPGDKVAGIMEEIRGPAGRTMWDKLSNVRPEVLANYFKNEYPQTVAVVLNKIRPEHAASVFGELPDD